MKNLIVKPRKKTIRMLEEIERLSGIKPENTVATMLEQRADDVLAAIKDGQNDTPPHSEQSTPAAS